MKPKRGRPVAAVKRIKRSTTFPPGIYRELEVVAEQEERTINELIVLGARMLLVARGRVAQP